MIRSLLRTITVVLPLALWTLSCDEADEAFDCQRVCERYQECYDQDYDVGACRDRCRDQNDEDAARNQADQCESCIGGESCLSATFACATECAGIVP